MKIRYVVAAIILAVAVTITHAQAQEPSTADQVRSWSLKHWVRAKAEFAKDKDKWMSCREQSKTQKLHGRASWQFLYGCMKA
jgi:hypothetical protein